MKVLPQPFEELMRAQLGSEAESFFTSLAEAPRVSVRVHPFKDHPWQSAESIPWSRWGRYLKSRPLFTLDPLFHAGTYYVQEASSMFLEHALRSSIDFSQPLKVLDLCAAPGGKSTHILSLLSNDSLLVANEVIRTRVNALTENIRKWGYPNCIVTNNDPSDFQRLKGFFDVMVVDAPCSGEGLFRKDAAAATEWSTQSILLCASRQRRILADAWDTLADGGLLIYSTCTFNRLENEENLRWLRDQQEVEFLRIGTQPSWGVEEVTDGPVIGYRFYPHRVRGEGFFISVMRKQDGHKQSARKPARKLERPPEWITGILRNWVNEPDAHEFFQFNDLVFFTPATLARYVEQVVASLHVVYSGTNAAFIKHKKLVPAHEMAMSTELRRMHFESAELDEATARAFLRREALHLSELPRGFALVTFKKTPLGWVNILHNRTNNLYPAEWRIRMSG